jgi:hypothetical protein
MKPFPRKLLHVGLPEVPARAEEALVGPRLRPAVVGDRDALDRANVICNLQQPPGAVVRVAVVGNAPGEDEVQGIVQGGAHRPLSVVVVDGDGAELLEEAQVVVDERGEVAPDPRLELPSIMGVRSAVAQGDIRERAAT